MALSLSLVTFTTSAHKLVISISQPRSLSVAFLRMMRERGDFFIIHEPGVPAWRMTYRPEKISKADYKNERGTFSEVKDLLKELGAQQNIFVKEESYAACNYVNDPEITKSQDTYIVFLVRNPHHVLLSMYNKLLTYGKITEKLSSQKHPSIDYEAMWQLFNEIKSQSVHSPLIIFVDDLAKNPYQMVEKFCIFTDIPFKKESLAWENLIDDIGDKVTWYDNLYARFDKVWHGDAWQSTGFTPHNKMYAVDTNGLPTFQEIEDAELRLDFLEVYNKNMPYYQLFLDAYKNQALRTE